MRSPQQAFWVDWRRSSAQPLPAGARVYFGHETCEAALPAPAAARDLARRLQGEGRPLTLVTPFLTAAGLPDAMRLVETLRAVDEDLEVVCGDWGLLARLARDGLSLALGRTLAAQQTDPRLLRLVAPADPPLPVRQLRHLDGTEVELRRRPPSPELLTHLRGCWLDRADVVAWLRSLGVSRAELSNVGQGLSLARHPGWSYSVHVPWVLVSAMRFCPLPGEKMHFSERCPAAPYRGSAVAWRRDGLPATLVRRDNALLYRWTELPADLEALSVDRVVHHETDGTPPLPCRRE